MESRAGARQATARKLLTRQGNGRDSVTQAAHATSSEAGESAPNHTTSLAPRLALATATGSLLALVALHLT